MSTAFRRDLESGRRHQELVLPLVRAYFATDAQHTADEYSRWDYTDKEGTLYELKSRNCLCRTYPTTMIAQDKVIGDGANQIFLFKFTDGLYYIRYNPDTFARFEVRQFRRWRPGHHDKEKPYIYVPVDALTRIEVEVA